MTDHPTTAARDLYEAILRDPSCDLVRLAYADEVDGHDDNRLAEFIRLQIRIAEIERECSCGACVKLRGGGQHTNGPCAVSRERDEMPDGTSKNAMLRLKESNLLDFGFDEIPAGVKLTYRRGFVDSVAMSLRAFMGGECPTCDSNGTYRFNHPERAGYRSCVACHGTGRTPGLAAVVCARWPVTSVRFSDYHPTPHSGDYWIIDEEVCDMIPTIDRELVYATDDDAIAALSNGAVNFGRQSVGLPLLIW